MQLELKEIKKAFDKQEVLTDCTYTFDAGKIYGLLGRNGAGKTTLFNVLYDEISRDAGESLLKMKGEASPLTPEEVGMVFTENYLPDFLTGYEFIQFFIDIHPKAAKGTADDYLDLIGINEKDRHRLIRGYSSGMQSKLSLLTIFIAQPPVILLDEPLTAVDVIAGIEIKKLLMNLKKDRIVILSTHMMQLARDLCDEIVFLRHGELSALEDYVDEAAFEEHIIDALREDERHV